MPATIAILPLARPTFDVGFAEENLAKMLAVLDGCGADVIGPRHLLFDAEATQAALETVLVQKPQMVLVLQVTFTDAAMIAEIGARHDGLLGIWAIPEKRTGGRLRLNSFCGLNLASHCLGLRARRFGWIYAAPDAAGIETSVKQLIGGKRQSAPVLPVRSDANPRSGASVVARLAGSRIGRIGVHPDGFDTCAYDRERLAALAGVEVDEIALPALFEQARATGSDEIDRLRKETALQMDGLNDVDRVQLDRSLALKLALDQMRAEKRLDAFAIRCWPETFTEYGGAACGPVSMMGEARVPCACEADVYGALTQMMLQLAADAPVFLTDIVDADEADDSIVLWHCGQAPVSMRAQKPVAQIHSNRKMPLLYEFTLKPGVVTLARISQAGGRQMLAIAAGTVLARPKSFTGTSGVVRLERPAGTFCNWLLGSGLEHHMALAYGDHRQTLLSVAAALAIPVLDLQEMA